MTDLVPAAGQAQCIGYLTMLWSDYLALAACLLVLLALILGVVSRSRRVRAAAAILAAAIVLFYLLAWRLPFLWI